MKKIILLLLPLFFITACDEVWNNDDTACEEPMDSYPVDLMYRQYIYISESTENQCSSYATDYINSDENLYTFTPQCSNSYSYKKIADFKTADDELINLSNSIDEDQVESYINTYCRPYYAPQPDTVKCFKIKDDSISFHYTSEGYKFKGEITISALTQDTCSLYTISCHANLDNNEEDECETTEN